MRTEIYLTIVLCSLAVLVFLIGRGLTLLAQISRQLDDVADFLLTLDVPRTRRVRAEQEAHEKSMVLARTLLSPEGRAGLAEMHTGQEHRWIRLGPRCAKGQSRPVVKIFFDRAQTHSPPGMPWWRRWKGSLGDWSPSRLGQARSEGIRTDETRMITEVPVASPQGA